MTLQTEKIILNSQRNVTLFRMTQNVGGEFGKITKRPAVLILPGGAYAACSDREAEVIAYPYLYAGFHAFVLRYSVGDYRTWPNPLDDYEQAMELIRSKEEWCIIKNRIAVIGFSAGGHLAACAATLSKNRPNAAILGYAALGHDIVGFCQPDLKVPLPADFVNGDTCPCFLFAARDDNVVPIKDTADFQSKLIEYGIQFETHIYAYAGHGFGNGAANINGKGLCRRVSNWVGDSIGWLEDVFGQLTAEGMGKPVCAGKVNGNSGEFLNVDCTLEYLKESGTAKDYLQETLSLVDEVVQKRLNGNESAKYLLEGMRLRELLTAFGKTEEFINELDCRLAQIPNGNTQRGK